MRKTLFILAALCALAVPSTAAEQDAKEMLGKNIQVGVRPYYLVDQMEPGFLKTVLESCSEGPFYKTDLSIGHRGAPLQFPEHTKESYEAAARQGAGILECDVTFTSDLELVCRHSQCDLHTTTNILLTPLAEKCSEPFTPADPETETSASARCCTSDITLAEFKSLCGKMDAANRMATTPEEYVNGAADWRTDLYATFEGEVCTGTLLSHAESIELFQQLRTKMTPELKAPSVDMPFNGFSQEDYAGKLIDEYRLAGVPAWRVFPQSFNLDDVIYWINNEGFFGHRAVFLEGVNSAADLPAAIDRLPQLVAEGVRIVAPPMWALLDVDDQGRRVPSEYALAIQAAGLDIITWTIERSGPLADGGGWYHQTTESIVDNDGDYMEELDVLVREVGVIGVFSDWPATVTYYASCIGNLMRR